MIRKSHRQREMSATVYCRHAANYDPRLRGYPNLGRSRAGEWGDRYLSFTGVSGTYATVPHSAALGITGDIGWRFRLRRSAFTSGSAYVIAAKEAADGQRAWRLEVSSVGAIYLVLSGNGSATTPSGSRSITPLNGEWVWIDLNWRQSDGRVRFAYSSDYDGATGTWSSLGADSAIAVASIHASTSPVEIASRLAGTTGLFSGDIQWFQMFASVDGTDKRLDIRPSDMRSQDSFVCSTGQTVTLAGAAQVIVPGWAMEPITESQRPVRVVETGLWLPGQGGNFARLNHASGQTGVWDELTITSRIHYSDIAAAQTIVGKYQSSVSRTWHHFLSSDGRLFMWIGDDVSGDQQWATLPDPWTPKWVRTRWNKAAGRIYFYHAPDDPEVPTVWTYITDKATTGVLGASSADVFVGAWAITGSPARGYVRRVIVENQTETIIDFDAANGLSQTEWVNHGTAGGSATINRATSGLKTVVMNGETSATNAFDGSDDRLTVADHPLLNMGAGQDFTVGALVRVFDNTVNFGRFIAKKIGSAAPGYDLETTNTNRTLYRGIIHDGTNSIGSTSAAPTLATGVLTQIAGARSGSGALWTTTVGGTPDVPQNASGVGSLANAADLVVGASSTPNAHQTAELPADFVSRQALSTAALRRLGWELQHYAKRRTAA